MSIEAKIPHITCEHLQGLRADADEHVVLDLRDFNEFEAGHISGSHNVPRRELVNNIKNIVPSQEHKVIVVIGPTEDPDIEKVYAELLDLGYKQVEVLAGGFDRYCEIAPLEIEPEILERTPEEQGFVGEGLTDVDPEGEDNEPLY